MPTNKEKIIILSNVSEDVLAFIHFMKNKVHEMMENNELGERALFYLADSSADVLVITPLYVPKAFLQYVQELFPETNYTALSPDTLGNNIGELSTVVFDDEKLLAKIKDFMGESLQIHIDAYAASNQLHVLIKKLAGLGKELELDVVEQDDQAVINSIGTKSGLRRLWMLGEFGDEIVMPDGVIYEAEPEMSEEEKDLRIEKACASAAMRYLDRNGVVIKTEKGHSGQGVLIFAPGSLEGGITQITEQIHQKLNAEPYWREFDIVLEDYIDMDKNSEGTGGGMPNAEFIVDENGVHLLYMCGMRVKGAEFQGVEIGKTVLRPEIVQQLRDMGEKVGKILKDGGYKGHFDIDTVFGKDGKLYLSESNVRYTGGSHAYHGAKALLKEDFDHKYIVAINIFEHANLKGKNFEQLREILSEIEYDKKTKKGLVIVSQALLTEGKFGFMILADDKDEATWYEQEMNRLLDDAVSSVAA